MTRARTRFDWNCQFKLALDGERARARFLQTSPMPEAGSDHCSMCGADFCAMRISRKLSEKLGRA